MDRIIKSVQKKCNDEAIINQVKNVLYTPSDNIKQNNANQCAAAMRKMEEIFSFDEIADIMSERSCCKHGKRLEDIKAFAKENAGKSLAEKVRLLSSVQYMGNPELTQEGYLTTNGCAGTWRDDKFKCSCWALGECVPQDGTMPSTYCLCCGGHFKFYYQKALGVKLKIIKVLNSSFMDETKPCAFLYNIL